MTKGGCSDNPVGRVFMYEQAVVSGLQCNFGGDGQDSEAMGKQGSINKHGGGGIKFDALSSDKQRYFPQANVAAGKIVALNPGVNKVSHLFAKLIGVQGAMQDGASIKEYHVIPPSPHQAAKRHHRPSWSY